jgi:hypothetical protein
MPRWLVISLVGFSVAVAAVAGVLLTTGADADDVVSFLGEGAVIQLREEMRPPRPAGPRVIVFAIDGVGDDEFRETLAAGAMPNIAALVGEETSGETYRHAYAPLGALSILPSTTYAAWTAVFTGEPVGRSGVAGNEWFDRETATFVAPAPVSVTIREHGLPDLQVVYFPGVDLFTHIADDPIVDQRRYLREVIDPAVGRILAAYDELGALDDTYVLFVSDHGHTPVLSDDRHALGTGEEGEPPSVLSLTGFRLRPDVLEPEEDEQDYQAAVAYQGAFAYVYLADRSTCPRAGDAATGCAGRGWRRTCSPWCAPSMRPARRAPGCRSSAGRWT